MGLLQDINNDKLKKSKELVKPDDSFVLKSKMAQPPINLKKYTLDNIRQHKLEYVEVPNNLTLTIDLRVMYNNKQIAVIRNDAAHNYKAPYQILSQYRRLFPTSNHFRLIDAKSVIDDVINDILTFMTDTYDTNSSDKRQLTTMDRDGY